MKENGALLVANSVYQLLTALHLKHTLLAEWDADLLLTDVTPGLKACRSRLEELGIFRQVLFARSKALGERYHMNRSGDVDQCFAHGKSQLRWMMDGELERYSQVYFANFDLLARLLACRYWERNSRFLWYEDGFSSYVVDYLREDRAAVNRHPEGGKIASLVEGALLYEPRLALRGDGLKNLPLPKISPADARLREELNHVFAYEKREDPADFLFLEQSFRAENIQGNDLELIEECRGILGAERFVVKPHPRNPENLAQSLGLSRSYPSAVPWELFLLNGEAQGKKLLTVCSNGTLTGRLVFGLDLDTAMLYRLFRGKVLWKEDQVLGRYLERFRRQLAGKNYYVPETIYELRNLLRFWKGSQR